MKIIIVSTFWLNFCLILSLMFYRLCSVFWITTCYVFLNLKIWNELISFCFQYYMTEQVLCSSLKQQNHIFHKFLKCYQFNIHNKTFNIRISINIWIANDYYKIFRNNIDQKKWLLIFFNLRTVRRLLM